MQSVLKPSTPISKRERSLVGGGKGTGSAALLTLVERKSRKLIIRKFKDKTQAAVKRAINGIDAPRERRPSWSFKSITADNGSEFLDYGGLEASAECTVKCTYRLVNVSPSEDDTTERFGASKKEFAVTFPYKEDYYFSKVWKNK